MASTYPGAIDSFDAVPATLAGPPTHELLHEEVHNALVAIQTELGTDPAGDASTVAARLAALPKGRVASASRTTSQSSIGTSATDLTGLSVTFTAEAGRRYRISGTAPFVQGATAANGYLQLVEGTTQIGSGGIGVVGTFGRTAHVWAERTPSAGSITYKLQAQCDAGTINMAASSVGPAVIIVEDIGAA